ncbi:MAG TPA: hypothetical protein VK154_06465 [Chitinophagales bacterium]|nr:hypothetical protein [Chitinophagales bacterium]
MKRFLLLVITGLFFLLPQLSNAQAGKNPVGGYATVRVFDCNKSVSFGTGYISAKIFIVYEDGKTEEIPLLSYSEKNELENLKTVNATINKLKGMGYFLIAQYTTGEQGNLISDYTFLKQQ